MPTTLTTLARVRLAMPAGTAATDDQLNPLLNAASAALAAHCRRDFGLGAWTEIRSGHGRETLRLRRYPVASVERVAAASRPALVVRHADPSATARPTPTGLTLLLRNAPAATFTWVAQPTLQAVADAVNALGGGWGAAAFDPYKPWPSADLQPTRAPRPAAGNGAELRVYDLAVATRLDAEAGLLDGDFPAGADNLRVEYTAGFDPIPEDLQQGCAVLAAHWFAETNRDPTVARSRLGTSDLRRFAPEAWPAVVRRLVDPYRNLAWSLEPFPARADHAGAAFPIGDRGWTGGGP